MRRWRRWRRAQLSALVLEHLSTPGLPRITATGISGRREYRLIFIQRREML